MKKDQFLLRLNYAGYKKFIPIHFLLLILAFGSAAQNDSSLFYDSHFHLTNYVQKGIDVHQFLQVMGTKVGRSTLFGIPLQQECDYENSGDFAPTYYVLPANRCAVVLLFFYWRIHRNAIQVAHQR